MLSAQGSHNVVLALCPFGPPKFANVGHASVIESRQGCSGASFSKQKLFRLGCKFLICKIEKEVSLHMSSTF